MNNFNNRWCSDKVEKKYTELCNTPSDINWHLSTLRKYASYCNHITEFGVRGVVSTWALLAANPAILKSYDINQCNAEEITIAARELDVDFYFIVGDTRKIEIENTDLLFIDTLHNYDQLSKELRLHGNRAKKYIIMHDTTTYEWHGESYDGKQYKGLWPAIAEFLSENQHWKIAERSHLNNGLTVLVRN